MNEREEKLSKEELELIEEGGHILKEVNGDSHMEDVDPSPGLRGKVYHQVSAVEAKRAMEQLTEEELELIHLGKVYKRKRKHKKYFVLAAVAVFAMAFGITSMGGPKRLVQVARRFVQGKEQIYISSTDEPAKVGEISEETEAYQKIKDEFGFYPVDMTYLPAGIAFREVVFGEETLIADLIYGDGDNKSIVYTICPQYRPGIIGVGIDDDFLDEYEIEVKGNTITIGEYAAEKEGETRWLAWFSYREVQYFISITNYPKAEVEKIVENLYFN